ncbi:Inner membrane protein YdjM [Moorella thermoacetica]|uniref:Inner membrane protein YdjM n=2 Tax=Neomoorella thermoacetica TaxID=1525 RepID=A0AAC9MTU0_NEOTH|nr:metal-dependent hydrolase [Moorella thermoacetica]AOQ23055.1 Inner membrane protein YdjM [Moorella thermoacetica]TYL08978.1 Inner membrane protein YdjM [Moorella thermoacetica]
MTARTHALGGFTAALLLAKTGCLGQYWLSLTAVGALGGLLPDVDHPGSYVGRRVPLVSDAVEMAFGHRGATHSLLAVFLFYLAARLAALRFLGVGVAGPLALALAAGYLSHLLLDMLNPQAVPLFWPWKARVRFPVPPIIPTGGLVEAVAVRGGLYAAAAYLGYAKAAGGAFNFALPGGVHLGGPLGEALLQGWRRFVVDVVNVARYIVRLFVK